MAIKCNANSGKTEVSALKEERTDFMSDRERRLKRKLIKLLKNDGRGHYHAMYAKRLEKYDVNIVPLGQEPSTAAISFDEGIIYINEGFLTDESTFNQLNVLMRHELCHDLLMHQIRMMHHITNIPWSHLRMSSSIHDIINIIEDFEISNKKYSTEDKAIVKHMWLNGQVISGLVTEDHRRNWLDMSLEQMYDALLKEYTSGGEDGKLYANQQSMTLDAATKHMHDIFRDTYSSAQADSIDELQNQLTAGIRAANKDNKLELPKEFVAIINAIRTIETDPKNAYSKSDIDDMLDKIAESSALKPFDLVSPVTGELIITLYTPEERWLAQECLKIIEGNTPYAADYKKWYKEIKQTIENDPDITAEDIQKLLDELNEKKANNNEEVN